MTTVSEESKYLEWLNVVANTRLVFNTMSELEDYLDNKNIHNNGIKRCFNTEQKARSAFYDLSKYAEEVTLDILDLETTMRQYMRASTFYQKKLSRKKNPEKVAVDILKYFYPCWEEEKYTKSMLYILEEIKEENYSIPILVLLLTKAWYGYESKGGDVKDFADSYNKVISLIDDFTKDSGYFASMPSISEAKQELYKTRLTLLSHIKVVLSSYSDFASPDSIFELAQSFKEDLVDIDIEGYWNECGGRAVRTDFWHIEKTSDVGVYFANKYNKKQNDTIEIMRYVMQIAKSYAGLIIYILHPQAPKHFLNGLPYDEEDHCFYHTESPQDWDDVKEINLTKHINYKGWDNRINLTKVTDKKLIKEYDSLIDTCTIVNKYEEWEYEFLLNLYAITREAIYIATADGNKFYKVPISLQESFSKITIDSRVGLIVMKKTTYIAFDEFMIYIPVKRIKKYGIEVVDIIV